MKIRALHCYTSFSLPSNIPVVMEAIIMINNKLTRRQRVQSNVKQGAIKVTSALTRCCTAQCVQWSPAVCLYTAEQIYVIHNPCIIRLRNKFAPTHAKRCTGLPVYPQFTAKCLGQTYGHLQECKIQRLDKL